MFVQTSESIFCVSISYFSDWPNMSALAANSTFNNRTQNKWAGWLTWGLFFFFFSSSIFPTCSALFIKIKQVSFKLILVFVCIVLLSVFHLSIRLSVFRKNIDESKELLPATSTIHVQLSVVRADSHNLFLAFTKHTANSWALFWHFLGTYVTIDFVLWNYNPVTRVCGSTEPRSSPNNTISQQMLEMVLRVIK